MYPPAAPRPGCVPLRPLGIGDIIEGSFRAVFRNPKVMLGFAAVVSVLSAAISAVTQLVLFANLHLHQHPHSSNNIYRTDFSQVDGTRLLISSLTALIGVVLSTVFGALVTGMLTLVVADDVIGRRSTLQATWARVRPRLLPIVGITVLTSFVEVFGLLLFVVPGVWLWGIWAVAIPVFMVEQTTVSAALSRSRSLARDTFWRVWGIRSLGALLIGALASVVTGPFTFAAFAVSHRGFSDLASLNHPVPTSYIVITAVGAAIGATFTTPLMAAFSTLQYVDLRMRKENLTGWLRQQSGTG